MAKVTIEVRTDAETLVEVTAHSLVRGMEERPDNEAGRVLDEAVRRVRAALGLPEERDGARPDAAVLACPCTGNVDPECPEHGDQPRCRSTDR